VFPAKFAEKKNSVIMPLVMHQSRGLLLGGSLLPVLSLVEGLLTAGERLRA